MYTHIKCVFMCVKATRRYSLPTDIDRNLEKFNNASEWSCMFLYAFWKIEREKERGIEANGHESCARLMPYVLRARYDQKQYITTY